MKKILFLLCCLAVSEFCYTQSVTIQPRSTLVIKGAAYLVVRNAALINNGNLVDSLGTVKFTGEADTVLSYLSGNQSTRLYNMEISKAGFGTALKSPVTVRNVLGVYNGTLYADSNLILHSDEDLTARVDIIPAGAGIKGKAIVERYYPKRRSWRLVTSPLSATTSIFDSWQNKGVYEVGMNTLVSGPNPTGAAGNGLDPSPLNNSSMKTWSMATQSLVPVLNTKVPLSPGNTGNADNAGYFLFVRGDRDINNFIIPNSNNTTLQSNGKLQTGTQTFSACSVAGGYSLIGNPFASPVDFNNVTRNNLVKRFYVWDPSLNTVGGYVMLDDLDGDGVFTKSVGVSSQNNHIQSSQAFFVQTLTNGAASAIFQETCKSAGNNNSMFRPAGGDHLHGMRIALNKVTDSSILFTDEVLLECNENFSDSIDTDDALKFTNINECIGLVRNNITLTAERHSPLQNADTLFLKLSRTTPAHYQFEITPFEINDPSLQAWIEDAYLQTSIPVGLQQTTAVDFIIDNNAASAAANRFRIVFKQLAVLPVHFISVHARREKQHSVVTWNIENEINLRQYEIERSTNGRDFITVGQQSSTGNLQYGFIDNDLAAGRLYYRIKAYSNDGSAQYSRIVSVEEEALPAINIYPNPVTGNSIHIYFNQSSSAGYHFRLYNTAGQLVYESDAEPINKTVTLIPKEILTAGKYQLEIISPNEKITKQIIIAH